MSMNYGIMIFILVYLVVILGAGLAVHIFNAIGLVAIARNRGIAQANLAWVPMIGTAYITGAIADIQTQRERGSDRNLKAWLLGLSLAMLILTVALVVVSVMMGLGSQGNDVSAGFVAVLILFWLIGMLFSVLWYVAHYKLFKACQPANSTVFTVLSIVFSIGPFLVFAVRHYVDGYRVS